MSVVLAFDIWQEQLIGFNATFGRWKFQYHIDMLKLLNANIRTKSDGDFSQTQYSLCSNSIGNILEQDSRRLILNRILQACFSLIIYVRETVLTSSMSSEDGPLTVVPPRVGHVAIAVGDVMIVWGGYKVVYLIDCQRGSNRSYRVFAW